MRADAGASGLAAWRIGVWQAVWLPAGFILIEVAVVALVLGRHLIAALIRRLLHLPPVAAGADDPWVFAATLVAGNLVAGLWAWRFLRRRAGPLFREGEAGGIGWCAATGRGYAVALLLAALLIGGVALLFHLVPPVAGHANAVPGAARAPAWERLVVGVLLLTEIGLIAPFSEELVFRGGMLAGLSGRLGVWGAGVVVTVLFVLLHGLENRGYPLGLLPIALMAVAALGLRLWSGSLRPGVLLHALYNLGAGLCAALAAGGALR